MKPILKKNRQESSELPSKRVMITDLCSSEKQKIGEMMMLMEKQKQEITSLHQQLKVEKEDRIIQREKMEEFKKESAMLSERIKEIEDKYIECCRHLDEQKQNVLRVSQRPLSKTIGTQTQQNPRIQTEMQTEQMQVDRQQLEQTVMNIMNIDDLKIDQQQKSKDFRQEYQYRKDKSVSPQSLSKNRYSKSHRQIPLLLPKPRRANQESVSNQKKQPSASKLAKQWIKTKKQKINKMKKDILKSERKMIKELSYTPENTEDNNEIQSDANSDKSNTSKQRNVMEEYLERLRGIKQEMKGSRMKTQQNRHPNISIHNPTDMLHLNNSRSKGELERSYNNRSNNLISKKTNKVDLDEDALNTMLKSKSFRANDVLGSLREKSGSKKSEHKLRGMYSSDLVDLIENIGD